MSGGRQPRSGFTLLEVLVATTILGVAVVGLMGALSQSLNNLGRVSDTEKVGLLARRQMDSLLAERFLPVGIVLRGDFPAGSVGNGEAAWRAVVLPFESIGGVGAPPQPGQPYLQRIVVEVRWRADSTEKRARLEAYRSVVARSEDVQAGAPGSLAPGADPFPSQ